MSRPILLSVHARFTDRQMRWMRAEVARSAKRGTPESACEMVRNGLTLLMAQRKAAKP